MSKFNNIKLTPTSIVLDKNGYVINTIVGEIDFNEFNKTLTVMKKWQAQPTFDLYKNYCEEAQVCAEQNALSSAAIEMFMFTAAPGKRPAQHIIK